ncbi:MAG: cytochrome C [Burkholderiales bacterium]|jgi:cytochrome c553
MPVRPERSARSVVDRKTSSARRHEPARAAFALIALVLALCALAPTPLRAQGASPASTPAGAPAPTPRPAPDSMDARVRACTGCHGDQGRATADGYYPRIAGKPAGYLANQLRNFRDGRRAVPAMTWMVEHLSDDYLGEIAAHFADRHPPYPPPPPPAASAEVLERGRRLVREGDPARRLPACVACHGDGLLGMQPAVPGLLGLPRDYLNAQLGAWLGGTRRAMPPDCMATIVRRMPAEDIAAVTAWLAAQPVPAAARPAAALPATLPLDCGGLGR